MKNDVINDNNVVKYVNGSDVENEVDNGLKNTTSDDNVEKDTEDGATLPSVRKSRTYDMYIT